MRCCCCCGHQNKANRTMGGRKSSRVLCAQCGPLLQCFCYLREYYEGTSPLGHVYARTHKSTNLPATASVWRVEEDAVDILRTKLDIEFIARQREKWRETESRVLISPFPVQVVRVERENVQVPLLFPLSVEIDDRFSNTTHTHHVQHHYHLNHLFSILFRM